MKRLKMGHLEPPKELLYIYIYKRIYIYIVWKALLNHVKYIYYNLINERGFGHFTF